MAGSSTPATYSNGPMTPTSHQGPSRGLHLPSKRLQTPSTSKPTTPTATPHTTAEPEVLTAKGKKRPRPRNIACITCNKQKKTCGSTRPCPRCVHLNIPCRQPVKPEGFVYNTKKQKIADGPLSPPVSPDDHNALMLALRQVAEINRQQKGFLPQNLPPSPSPSVSTVGTPRDFYTSASSYNDPATGKHGDVTELNSCMSPHSVSLNNEAPRLSPVSLDMSRWSLPALPAPAEEVPYNVVKHSLFNGAPVFGLEKSIFDSELTEGNPFTEFGEPVDLADLYTDVMDNEEIQGAKEREGGDEGKREGGEEGKREEERGDDGAEVGNAVTQGPPVVAAGSAMSGIAPETGSGISWLDAADLLTDDLVLDDVDLSNLDITGLDDIMTESDIQQLLELSISKLATPPAISGSPLSRP